MVSVIALALLLLREGKMNCVFKVWSSSARVKTRGMYFSIKESIEAIVNVGIWSAEILGRRSINCAVSESQSPGSSALG